MKDMFSAGELAKYQNISKQTLIFYDKIGLFRPAFTDPNNGYRYYSAEQLDYLDTILIMKKIGFSLEDIRTHMQSYRARDSLAFFRGQLSVIDRKLSELALIRSRLEHRCDQVEQALLDVDKGPVVAPAQPGCLLCCPVEAPFGLREISIATKSCYAQAFQEDLPIFFQCGVNVPLERIRAGRYVEASTAFVNTEFVSGVQNIRPLPGGLTVSICHLGSYQSIGSTYQELLHYCEREKLKIVSDSYEFCLNDYVTSRCEEEFITKVLFYVEREP